MIDYHDTLLVEFLLRNPPTESNLSNTAAPSVLFVS